LGLSQENFESVLAAINEASPEQIKNYDGVKEIVEQHLKMPEHIAKLWKDFSNPQIDNEIQSFIDNIENEEPIKLSDNVYGDEENDLKQKLEDEFENHEEAFENKKQDILKKKFDNIEKQQEDLNKIINSSN